MDWSDLVPHLHGVASLATVTDDDRPHVSIVNPAVEERTIWISTFATARKVRNVVAHPWVSLVWAPESEAYVDGSVVIVDDLDERRRLWGIWSFDPAMFFERPDHPNYVLLRVTPERASLRSFGPDGPRVTRWSA